MQARRLLHTIIAVTKTDFDPCDLHSVTGVWSIRGSESSARGDEQDDCQKTQTHAKQYPQSRHLPVMAQIHTCSLGIIISKQRLHRGQGR